MITPAIARGSVAHRTSTSLLPGGRLTARAAPQRSGGAGRWFTLIIQCGSARSRRTKVAGWGLSISILRSRGFQLTTRGASPSGTSAVWRGPSRTIVSPRSSHHSGRCSMTSTNNGLPENDSRIRSPATTAIGPLREARVGYEPHRGKAGQREKYGYQGNPEKKPPSFRNLIADRRHRQKSGRQHPSPRELEPCEG